MALPWWASDDPLDAAWAPAQSQFSQSVVSEVVILTTAPIGIARQGLVGRHLALMPHDRAPALLLSARQK
jgi:hypothetical protein